MNPIGSTLQQRYQILEQLGSAGAVTTYLAVDLQIPGNLQLKCAIHRYELLDINPDSDSWDRTWLSAQTLYQSSRQGDRLPTIYSYFAEGEAFYLVREFVAGCPLAQELLADRPWTESQLVMLLVDLLEVLQDIYSCEVIPDEILLSQLLRRHFDRKIVLVNFPIVTGLAPHPLAANLPPTQRDLRMIGDIAIAAATGRSSADLPLSALDRAQWQQQAPQIHQPELIAIIDRLVVSNLPDSYTSISAAWQAVAKVMSQLLVQHHTPTDSQTEIARHVRLLVDRGTEFYEVGDCAQAIVAYDRALSLDDLCVDAYCGRGNSRRYLGDYAGSGADFDRAISLDPSAGVAYVGRALAASFQHQPGADPIADFQRGKDLLAHPRTTIEYVMRGTAHAQLRDNHSAIADYDAAIALNPRLVVAYNNRGNLRQHMGDLSGAVADFTRVLEIDSRSPIAYNNRAIVYTHMSKFPQAIADYTLALDLQPNFTSAYNNRANTYCQMGEYAAAIADYSKSIALDPEFAIAYCNRGNIERIQGHLEQAAIDYDLAICIDPNLTIAYYNRGICHRQLGHHQEAIADYTQTLTLDPEYFYAYYHRGNARQYLGDLHGAIADFTQTIRFDPEHLHAHYNRAVTRIEIDDLQAAMEDIEQVIQFQPKFGLAYYQRGRILAIDGQHQSALADYHRAIDLKPEHRDIYYQRGCSRQILGDLAGALTDFSHSLDLDPRYAPAYDRRGKVHIQLGDRSGAIADYHQAASLYLDRGDSKTYQQTIELIDRLSAF